MLACGLAAQNQFISHSSCSTREALAAAMVGIATQALKANSQRIKAHRNTGARHP